MARKPLSLPALDANTDERTEFFMTASHQLKSPVAIVQWCLQSTLEDPTLSASSRSMTQKALVQANAMSQLLGDMLRVFRIVHKGEGQRQLVSVDLNKILTEVIEQYETVAHTAQVKLLLGPIEHLPMVLADEGYLKQAVINVIDNAIKYSNPNGRIEISARVHAGQVELAVHDHGIGIPDAEQGRLFTEFFRGEGAKQKTHEGTGLGLVLVKHIMESFGGRVLLQSNPKTGTIFTLSLPVPKN